MSSNYGAGFHVAPGRAVDTSAYDRYIGRWSRLFVPSVLAAAEVGPGCRVLDVSTGTGEAAVAARPIVGDAGFVAGADISSAMLKAAQARLGKARFWPVAADGQALPFRDASFHRVICQLGLQFFPDPAQGLTEFRRVLRSGGSAAVCVVGGPDEAPMWGFLADALSRFLPEQRSMLYLTFRLNDPARLEGLFRVTGFHDVRVVRETRRDVLADFDEYWDPIEAGIGAIPQAYLSLSQANRRLVRAEVKGRLTRFESDGKLVMGVEMLIASGRA